MWVVDVAPFPSNVTLYELEDHLAYNVVFAVGLYDAPALPIFVPPSLAVYHPAKTYPDFVADGNVMDPPDHLAVNVVFAASPQYFALEPVDV